MPTLQPAGLERVGRRLASPAEAHRGRDWEPSKGSQCDRRPERARHLDGRPRSLSHAILDHLRPNQVSDVVSARLSRMEAIRKDVASLPNRSQVHPMAAR